MAENDEWEFGIAEDDSEDETKTKKKKTKKTTTDNSEKTFVNRTLKGHKIVTTENYDDSDDEIESSIFDSNSNSIELDFESVPKKKTRAEYSKEYMNEEEKPVEVRYLPAPIGRRIFATLFDFFPLIIFYYIASTQSALLVEFLKETPFQAEGIFLQIAQAAAACILF